MTGTTAIENYDKFVQQNYKRLYTHAYVFTHDEEDAIDLLHDTYIKVKEYIIMSGFTTQRFITHMCTSIKNRFIDNKRRKKYEFCTDAELYEKEDVNISEEVEEEMRENEYLCKYAFKYIERHYTEKELYVFRVYYAYPPKNRMTYAKISEQTGLGISYCSETIKAIRIDLKNNLIKFINENESNKRATC